MVVLRISGQMVPLTLVTKVTLDMQVALPIHCLSRAAQAVRERIPECSCGSILLQSGGWLHLLGI
eukprot:6424542-Amphidinium_carterae.1